LNPGGQPAKRIGQALLDLTRHARIPDRQSAGPRSATPGASALSPAGARANAINTTTSPSGTAAGGPAAQERGQQDASSTQSAAQRGRRQRLGRVRPGGENSPQDRETASVASQGHMTQARNAASDNN
jgi:hypothetical protein